MNKIQKRRQVKNRRLQQEKNKQLNIALSLISHHSAQTSEELQILCKPLSIRILTHLAKAKRELPDGLSLVNKIHEAAQSEIVERKLLNGKGSN